ncbi:MAG: hypothetical protein ABSC13_04955, partial [Dehalococcoidia bacterium]
MLRIRLPLTMESTTATAKRTALTAVLLILGLLLGSSRTGTCMGPRAAGAPCPVLHLESDLLNDTCDRDSFVVDPGAGHYIQRTDYLSASVFSYYRAQGFSSNFLWYAPNDVLHVSHYPGIGGASWSACDINGHRYNPATGNLSLCNPPAGQEIGYPNINSDASNTVFQTSGTVDLHVISWGNTFISTVCGNYSPDKSGNPTPQIVITKFWDKDRDGVRDASEPVLAGWNYNLSRTASSVAQGTGFIASGTTGADGTVTFSLNGQGPGTYAVDEVAQNGWVASTPTRAYFAPSVGIGNQTFVASFGNYKLPTLTVVKDLLPGSDPGKFNLQVDGATCAANVGDGGSCTTTLSIGSHTVGETDGTGT